MSDVEAEKVLAAWTRSYQRAFGVSYPLGTPRENVELCQRLIDNLGASANLAIHCPAALLEHEKLAWVNNKTLAWLANPRNLTWLLPVVKQARTSAASSPEWSQGHDATPSTTIIRRKGIPT